MALAKFTPNAGPGGFRRISIDHKKGGFKGSDGSHFHFLNGVVFLSLISTRKMWGLNERNLGEMSNEDKAKMISARGLLCKSPNNVHGIPGKNFGELANSAGPQHDLTVSAGFICAPCPFKNHSQTRPVCKQSYFVLFVFDNRPTEIEVLELSQSGITETKGFFQALYDQEKLHEGTYDITTKMISRGDNEYCKPEITYKQPQSVVNPISLIPAIYAARDSITKDFYADPHNSKTTTLRPLGS